RDMRVRFLCIPWLEASAATRQLKTTAALSGVSVELIHPPSAPILSSPLLSSPLFSFLSFCVFFSFSLFLSFSRSRSLSLSLPPPLSLPLSPSLSLSLWCCHGGAQ